MRTGALIALLLFLTSCKPAEESHSVAIAGAVLIDGAGGPALTDSMVVISGGLIRAAGRRTELSVPADASVLNGAGHYIVPAPIDVSTGNVALPLVSTLAEARTVVSGGATGFIGIMRDTADPDPAFVSELRDLKIIVAPSLNSAGDALETARKNTLRLFSAGVSIAVAGNGDPLREAQLLADAGIPPLDVIVAATRNGARALGQAEQRGTIQPGKRADLLLLTANPGEDIRNLNKVERRMQGGEWR
jgi:imidazolonepropionase-like amidohydrolase